MSWIFGSSARNENQFDLNYFKSIHSLPHFTYTNDHLYIAAGGNSRTCFYNQNENNSGWIACGVGLKSTAGTTRIYTRDNWTNLFSKDIFPDEEFNGHYAALKWNEGEIKLYTDILGLRDFYVAKTNKFIYFSTRIDWIAKVIDTEINLKSFGSRWLLYNQMSNESILTNIVRINRGTSALIKNGTIQIDQSKKSLLNNTLNENADYEFDNILNNFVNFSSESNKLVFALSGGLDSRLILSYLLKHKQGKFDTVTFGNAKHPDAVIPKSMADEIGFNHRVIHTEFPSEDKIISEIEEAVKIWQVTNPVSAILNLRYYNKINKSSVIIDGGFGEIWRLELLKKFQLKGRKSLDEKNYKEIIRFLKYSRADIFNDESIQQMEMGALKQIEILIESLPEVKEIGIENWTNLFSLNVRLPNFEGFEQTRLDNFSISYMPFIQQHLLKILIINDLKHRKNGKMFKQIIKKNYARLAEFPLVKGNVIYPFFLSSIQARLWSRIKLIGKNSPHNIDSINLFEIIKDYLMDLVRSEGVRNYPYYNYVKINNLVENFYGGNYNLVNELDWFLSFELFRQSISGK